jgi:hypothetical protein
MTELTLNENERILLKIAQECPGAWFMTNEQYLQDILSLEEKGLVERVHEENSFGTVYYRYPERTLH